MRVEGISVQERSKKNKMKEQGGGGLELPGERVEP